MKTPVDYASAAIRSGQLVPIPPAPYGYQIELIPDPGPDGCQCKEFTAKEKERIRVEMDFIRELFDQSKEDGLSDLEQQILDFFVKDVSAWVNSHD